MAEGNDTPWDYIRVDAELAVDEPERHVWKIHFDRESDVYQNRDEALAAVLIRLMRNIPFNPFDVLANVIVTISQRDGLDDSAKLPAFIDAAQDYLDEMDQRQKQFQQILDRIAAEQSP